ncbi:MAG: DUF6034 family protein [Candidatus Faecousia sp.]|nr:DUF6034 family protein [Candidatus Faecousia sp.]
MKKKTMRMLSAALAVTLLSGCGAAQTTTPAETSVNQAMLLEKSAQPQESAYTFPEKFTGDWTGQEGKLTIHADAQVVAELGTALPTATVEPREFNQEDVDNLLKVFLKGEPLYSHVQTKQELQGHLDYINSPDWTSDPGKPSDPASLEARRKELNAWYTAEIAKAPEEKPILHGFSDSDDPKWIGGTATVDGIKWEVSIRNDIDGGWTAAYIERTDYKYRDYSIQLPDASKEESIARGNALMQALGLQNFVLTDAQQWSVELPGDNGIWRLYYAPTVNGFPIAGARQDITQTHDGTVYQDYQYWDYACKDSENPDTVSWDLENILLDVGKNGVLRFAWTAPSTKPVVRQAESTLLPFEEIASIANTMLTEVIVGPKETPLTQLDQYNGFDTRMDVDITKVSLSLMRIRDKGSLQGTIVPVWDFWGTSDWYDAEPNAYGYQEKGMNYDFQPMLTLNAVDGTVVDRQLGY